MSGQHRTNPHHLLNFSSDCCGLVRTFVFSPPRSQEERGRDCARDRHDVRLPRGWRSPRSPPAPKSSLHDQCQRSASTLRSHRSGHRQIVGPRWRAVRLRSTATVPT